VVEGSIDIALPTPYRGERDREKVPTTLLEQSSEVLEIIDLITPFKNTIFRKLNFNFLKKAYILKGK
jgi:hypothetical protein